MQCEHSNLRLLLGQLEFLFNVSKIGFVCWNDTVIPYGDLGIHWIAGTKVGDCSLIIRHIHSVLIFQFLEIESLEMCVSVFFLVLVPGRF